MLLFDWTKVYDTAAGSIYNCNMIMEMLIKGFKSLKTSTTLFINFRRKTFHGNSFLVHPELLLYHSHKYGKKKYVCIMHLLLYGACQNITHLTKLH